MSKEKEAIRRGKAFEDLGCLWWEEPIPADDVDGYAKLTEALGIPVATGENLYTKQDFARFLRHNNDTRGTGILLVTKIGEAYVREKTWRFNSWCRAHFDSIYKSVSRKSEYQNCRYIK
jgi:3-methyladenine DNA glycosylase Mpg